MTFARRRVIVGGRVCTAVSGSVNRRMRMVVSSWHQPATNHICEESDSAKRLFQWTGSHGGQASRVESAEDHTYSCRMVSSTPVLVGLVCGKLAKSIPYTWLGHASERGKGGLPPHIRSLVGHEKRSARKKRFCEMRGAKPLRTGCCAGQRATPSGRRNLTAG